MPEKCGRGVQEKRDLGFLKETESGSGCESKAADHQVQAATTALVLWVSSCLQFNTWQNTFEVVQ